MTVVSLIMQTFCVFSVKHGQINYKNWIPSNHTRHRFPTTNTANLVMWLWVPWRSIGTEIKQQINYSNLTIVTCYFLQHTKYNIKNVAL